MGWVGLGRVTENGPTDNSAVELQWTLTPNTDDNNDDDNDDDDDDDDDDTS